MCKQCASSAKHAPTVRQYSFFFASRSHRLPSGYLHLFLCHVLGCEVSHLSQALLQRLTKAENSGELQISTLQDYTEEPCARYRCLRLLGQLAVSQITCSSRSLCILAPFLMHFYARLGAKAIQPKLVAQAVTLCSLSAHCTGQEQLCSSQSRRVLWMYGTQQPLLASECFDRSHDSYEQ